ncbi:MAG: methylhydantoinase [Alphaproteobacteria bacterium]|nr:MAG: methylhydantoinase [Alphaproteobacteria bacterium]
MKTGNADLSQPARTIGVDVGGTFTDVVLNAGNGDLRFFKHPTSPDIVEGIVAAVSAISREQTDACGQPLRIHHLHGTTVATNALLEGKGARIGLLTTAGHEDILSIGRQKRRHPYDLNADKDTPESLVPRHLRIGIGERVGGRGELLRPVDPAEVAEAARILVEEKRVAAIAICFLNSYLNDVNEMVATQTVHSRYPAVFVSVSARISPVFREYERSCATVFDAYVRPIVERYLRTMEQGFGQSRITQQSLNVMVSRGGVVPSAVARNKPVSMMLSGPAAGVVGARHVAARSGHLNLITMDTGGTSTEVALVLDGDITSAHEGRIGNYPFHLPAIDIHTVAAGGGSIAWTDGAGSLKVGPASAGSNPGPACYGRGGDDATVTDASIVLGYIDPDYFANGALSVDRARAFAAVERYAARLGMEPDQAALGIHRVLNAHIAEAIRTMTVKRGIDPRRFTLVPFGGGGGVHAATVARILGIRKVLVPRNPGTLSAFGMLVSELQHDGVESFWSTNAAFDTAAAEAVWSRLETEGAATLASKGITDRPVGRRRSMDLRYVGQGYELEIPVGLPTDAKAIQRAFDGFHQQHDRTYGHSEPGRAIEVVNLRALSFQTFDGIEAPAAAKSAGARADASGKRAVVLPGIGTTSMPIHRRHDLAPGHDYAGPCIVEQEDTTIVVLDGQTFVIDASDNLIISSPVADQ